MNQLKKLNDLASTVSALGVILSLLLAVNFYVNDWRYVQQNSLKAIIYNSEVELIDRVHACDIYLDKGFNSATGAKCKVVVKDYEHLLGN